MSQEQIHRQPTRRLPQNQQAAQTGAEAAPLAEDGTRQANAIDDAIRDILGPAPAASEMIGTPREQRTVRPATTSEEFVRNFRQHGGQ